VYTSYVKEHPFDRYKPFTDIVALQEYSEKPLRKSVRVNTLQMSIEDFRVRGRGREWKLEQAPWCKEGFFVDRPSPVGLRTARRPALGKDLLHLTGHIYMQEAASMLPAELLDPQPFDEAQGKPGEIILDMSAAPGSKTTQMAARMQNRGVIVANDIQEKRLWTLKTALHRSGVTNVVVTKKPGQWFGKHMVERFDRVLCDAPCTAQGTSRKDPEALKYSSQENIEKMSRIQVQLLEAAVHAAKVGGRIVYSTCTLTPEENEEVVMKVLEQLKGKVDVIDPREHYEDVNVQQAVEDSFCVQRCLSPTTPACRQAGYNLLPVIRLWPQTFDTEGFFCAVLKKIAVTREKEQYQAIPLQEVLLPASKQREIMAKFEALYDTSFMAEGEVLVRKDSQILLAAQEAVHTLFPVQDFALGLPYAKLLKDGRVRLAHEMAIFRGMQAKKLTYAVTEEEAQHLLQGRDISCANGLRGDLLLLYDGMCIGRGLAKEGTIKNNLPRTMIVNQ